MAYFVDMAQTFAPASGTLNANMPAHVANDCLIAYVTIDSGTIALPAGWVALPSAPANPVSNGTITYLAYKMAAGAAETFSGVAVGDAYTCGIYCWRDVDATAPFDGVTPDNASAGAAAVGVTCPSVTTATADALVVYLCSFDGTTPQAVSGPGVMWIDGFDSTGATATTSAHQAAAWYIQRAAGATPAATFLCNAANTAVRATFALRNKAGGRIPAYIDDVTSPATMLTPAHHTAAVNNVTFTGTLTNTADINGKTVAGSAPTLGADFGINPYCNAVGVTAAIAAATALNGYEITLTGGRNLNAGLLMGSLIALSPKSGTFGLGSVAQGGYVVRLGSSATDWKAYQVAGKDTPITTEQRYVFAIEPGYAGSQYATGGTFNNAAVTYAQCLRNCPSFAANIYLSELHQVFAQVIAGGDAANPVNIAGLVAVGKSFRLPVIQANGASGVFAFSPIQIGGGDAVNFQVNAGVLQFPRRYDISRKEIAYHASDNKVGIYFAGKSGDTIKFTDSLVTSPTPYIFEVMAAATNAATWDFTGLAVVGANVILRPVVTYQNVSFSSCPSLATTGSTLQNCKFSKTPISVTSPAHAALISSSTITSGGTGHGITITGTAANISLNALAFSGYAASNGSTGNEAIFVNIATGSMTISITGSGSTPSIRTAGATVTVSNSKRLTLTGMQPGSDVVVLAAGTTTTRLLVDSNAGTSYNYDYSDPGTLVDIGVIKPGYVPLYIRNYSLASSDTSLPVNQVIDRNYA